MAYRIARRETVADGLRRVVDEQIQLATADLAAGQDRHEAIHQARKRFKKIRGVLRLIRPALGELYATENAFYRDLGRDLARVRDAQAMVECLDALRAALPDRLGPALFDQTRAELVRQRDAAVAGVGDIEGQVANLVAAWSDARARLTSWPAMKNRFTTVREGLRQTYRAGRNAMDVTLDAPSGPHFHEWRKHAKYHWYHGRLLEGIFPELMKGHRAALRNLSGLLGDDHDLTVLQDVIGATPEAFGSGEEVRRLLEVAGQHQRALRSRAHALGARVYAEKPGAFAERWAAYWRAWR